MGEHDEEACGCLTEKRHVAGTEFKLQLSGRGARLLR